MDAVPSAHQLGDQADLEAPFGGDQPIRADGRDVPAEPEGAVLEACGRPVHLGPLGSGEVAEACNQLIVSAAVLALGETAVLADRSGLELATLVEPFEGGLRTAASCERADRGWSRTTFARPGWPGTCSRTSTSTDVATTTRTDTALLPALRAAFADLVARGFGDHDMAVTKRYVEERSRRR